MRRREEGMEEGIEERRERRTRRRERRRGRKAVRKVTLITGWVEERDNYKTYFNERNLRKT